jgi:hypothetical protein
VLLVWLGGRVVCCMLGSNLTSIVFAELGRVCASECVFAESATGHVCMM